jgi:hypothetical protein
MKETCSYCNKSIKLESLTYVGEQRVEGSEPLHCFQHDCQCHLSIKISEWGKFKRALIKNYISRCRKGVNIK